MSTLRRTVATVATTALVASPLAVLTAAPAHADGKERHFRVGGADVDFEVEKDDGRFEVDVDVDDARPGTRYRIVLRHNGKRFYKRVHRADRDGDVADFDGKRRNTRGKDNFKIVVKKINGPKKVRTIRMR